MSEFKLSIITLQGTSLHEHPISRATFYTGSGQITVLNGHAALIADVKPGMLEYEDKNGITSYAISGGFVEVHQGGNMYLMLDVIEHPDNIDLKAAEEARDRAEKILAQKQNLSDIEFARFESMLEHELSRIKIATGGRK
jgi:F-type H+-transporting ATPase subunit epsilon